MTEVYPFLGVRYNQERVGDLGSVICPPYDVISAEEQRAYYDKSEYNVVRLEHGLELPEDEATDNKHIRANTTFNEWLSAGILQTDAVPSFYIHEHIFTYQNMRKRRLGLVACIRLEQWESKVVFPHENTVPGIKSDRLELMRASKANFSPLLSLYEDPGERVAKLLVSQTKRRPMIDFVEAGEAHRLWMSNEPEFVQRVGHFLAPKPIYIADGHHRYETALAYRDERQQSASSGSEGDAFNFVMMTLVSFSDPGLVALPVHRLVRGISSATLAALSSRLENFFQVESYPLGETGLPEVPGATTRVVGLEPERIVGLKLRPSVSLKEAMPEGHSEAYQKLDVSIVQHLVIEKLMASGEKGNIAYTPDAEQARKQVESGAYQLAFLLNPVAVRTIKAIADANDRMPGKSTYFYPKLPTGLVINRLAGRL